MSTLEPLHQPTIYRRGKYRHDSNQSYSGHPGNESIKDDDTKHKQDQDGIDGRPDTSGNVTKDNEPTTHIEQTSDGNQGHQYLPGNAIKDNEHTGQIMETSDGNQGKQGPPGNVTKDKETTEQIEKTSDGNQGQQGPPGNDQRQGEMSEQLPQADDESTQDQPTNDIKDNDTEKPTQGNHGQPDSPQNDQCNGEKENPEQLTGGKHSDGFAGKLDDPSNNTQTEESSEGKADSNPDSINNKDGNDHHDNGNQGGHINDSAKFQPNVELPTDDNNLDYGNEDDGLSDQQYIDKLNSGELRLIKEIEIMRTDNHISSDDVVKSAEVMLESGLDMETDILSEEQLVKFSRQQKEWRHLSTDQLIDTIVQEDN